MTTEPELCSCGYPDGTFACKIRHQHLNTGDAKASRDLDGRGGPSARTRREGIDVITKR